MGIIVAFLIIMGAVTVIGHAIWIGLAALIKRPGPSQRPRPEVRPAGDELADVDASTRQMRRLYERGILDQPKFDWLIHVLQKERHRVLGATPQIRTEPVTLTPSIPAIPTTPSAPPSPEPVEPTKPVAEILTGFMETRNIRWGELIGGLLIIGCSLALVISFWSQIDQIPLVKFFVFTLMTGAFAGLGLYSENRWKLPHTSRGLLLTAVLLVPLNLLAIAAFSGDSSSAYVMAIEAASILFFTYIVYRSGQIITPGLQLLLTIGVLVPSVLQLGARRFLGGTTSVAVVAAFCAVPVVVYHVVSMLLERELKKDGKDARTVLTLFSAATFASFLSFGFILFKAGSFWVLLSRVGPLVCLLGAPVLLIGVSIWKRHRDTAALAITGSSVAILGSGLLAAGLVLAWPQAGTLVFAALINFGVLSVVAFSLELPIMHLPALACLGLASAVGANLAAGRISDTSSEGELVEQIVSAFTGVCLTILFVAIAGTAEMLSRKGRRGDGIYYLISAGVVGFIALALSGIFGFGRDGDPHHVTWVFLVFAAAAFYGARRYLQPAANYLGLALLLVASEQLLHFTYHFRQPLALLVFASLTTSAGFALRRLGEISKQCLVASLVVGGFAGFALVSEFERYSKTELGWLTLWLAGIWLALSFLLRKVVLFPFFQMALAVSATCFARALAPTDKWATMYVLAAFCLAWALLRMGTRRWALLLNNTEDQSIQARIAGMLFTRWPPFDQLVAILLVATFLVMGIDGFFSSLDHAFTTSVWHWKADWLLTGMARTWLLLLILAATWIVTLWNPADRLAVAGGYLVMIAAAITVTASFAPAAHTLIMTASLIILFTMISGLVVWHWREQIRNNLERLGIRRAAAGLWFTTSVGFLALAILLPCTIGVLSFHSIIWRLIAGAAALAVCPLVLLLAGDGWPKQLSRFVSLSSGFAGLILCGWATLSPWPEWNVFSRLVVVFIVAVAVSELLVFRLNSRLEWADSGRRFLPVVAVAGLVALAGIFTVELAEGYHMGEKIAPTLPVLLTLAALLLMCGQALLFAVRPARDPFALTEAAAKRYVYAAEGLLALAFLHLRLTMPWLFGGWFQRFWPFGVVLIAFLGVGAGELFRRRGREVLAGPLHQTGFFLPLLPSLAFWVLSSEIDYSELLIAVGALYALVAVMRQSVVASLLACLAANGALWHYLGRLDGTGVLERPQLWLAPLGISVLAAAYFNRKRLSPSQMTGFRYAALMLIYVSSTAEIFIIGVGTSPWQPLVLMTLSTAGLLCGILLRVKAFLYLGSSFLLISILAIIWHAARNLGWTWLWYVTGIVLGAGIILLFALFEKKRERFQEALAGLREWEA